MNKANDPIVRNMAWPAIAEFPESLMLLDTSNDITYINSAAQKNFDIDSASNKIPVGLRSLFGKAEEADILLKELKENGTCSSEDIVFVTGNGTELRTSYKACVLRNDDGVTIGTLLLIGLTPTTKLKEYASRLESKIKELDQFAYIVSHDLKAPLRAIGNLTTWIREDLEGTLTGDSKQNMDLLVSRVNRMEALINGILEYSRIGRIQVNPESVDVHVLVTELIELLSPPSSVIVTIDPNLPSFVARRILLSQVFSNLISNAIKHNNKEKPLINVGFKVNGESFEFFVEDNGPGIAKEHHEKIFVIFQTLQSRDKFESTGIGLTIVKRIIEEQGGEIRVESTPGTGSKFIFTWPQQSVPEAM